MLLERTLTAASLLCLILISGKAAQVQPSVNSTDITADSTQNLIALTHHQENCPSSLQTVTYQP